MLSRLYRAPASRILALCLGGAMVSSMAHALDLDWSGQFRTETHWVYNYSLESGNTTVDPARQGKGYYVPGGGANNAFFQTLFMRLQPKVVVNDNIYVKSEWWVGDPVFGFFGNAAGHRADQTHFSSTASRGSTITAQRFWAEFLSDFGTIQVGRIPLHWGLGAVWNSGNGLWDRYQSTGDAVRLVSKFGSFSFSPGIIKYSMGNSIGGSCQFSGGTCNITSGEADLRDISLMFKYENLDEDMELGVNFVKRLAAGSQDPNAGFSGFNSGTPAALNYNIWDIYGSKKLGDLTISGELPVTTGEIAGVPYKTYAIALETKYKFSDSFNFGVKAGHIPGQPNISSTIPGTFRAFFLHPSYNVGMIMFNYQLTGFAGPNTLNNAATGESNLSSPFDNSINNAQYAAATASWTTGKWEFHSTFLIGQALETAETSGRFYNGWQRKFEDVGAGVTAAQSKGLGWELDLGTSFRWDDSFTFGLDLGYYLPGDFYRFSNTAQENDVSSLFATQFRVGVEF